MPGLKSKYDVVVIGAGPVGIYTSLKLARNGLRVLVIEEDSEIGRPRFCTGLISSKAFDTFNLPREAIEGEFYSAWVISPLGSRVCLKGSDIKIYVTDRAIFDQGLYNQAKESGVEFLLQCRCSGIEVNDESLAAKIRYDGAVDSVRAEAAVLATGIKYNLHRLVGLDTPPDFLDCSQVQIEGSLGSDIEIFMGNSVAPHSFAWIVPLRDNKLRIGMSTKQDSVRFLKSFLEHLKLKERIGKDEFDIMRRPIPLGTIKNTYSQRILVVGDAAGQVKTTTGGGIYFGLLCADLAAQTITEAFKKRDFSSRFLCQYEINWKKKIGFDLTMGLYLRKFLAYLNDGQIERLVQFCAQESTQRLIEEYADFDHHGKFINELIKNPLFWKSLHHLFITG